MDGTTTIVPYSPEWFIARQGCFTASEIWKLMVEPKEKQKKEVGELSETALTYVLEKVWEKLTGITKQGFDSMATQWGVEQEPHALKWYQIKTGNKFSSPYLCFMKDLKGFTCTPDGFINEDGLIENKAPYNGANHLKHCFITNDEYFKKNHKEYYWQCQAQMLITGRKWCDFISYDPRIDSALGMFIYRLKANDDDHYLLIEKIKKARILFEGYLISFKGEKIEN